MKIHHYPDYKRLHFSGPQTSSPTQANYKQSVEAVSLNSHLQQEIAELAKEKAEKKPATAATLRQVTKEINACLSMREKPVKTTFLEVAGLIFSHLPKHEVDTIVKEAEQPEKTSTETRKSLNLTG